MNSSIQSPLELLGRRWRNAPNGLLLPTCGLMVPPPRRKPTKRELYGDRPVHIDLFAGAGGFGLGIVMAGFETIAALDYEPDCALTYMSNLCSHPVQVHYIEESDRERMETATASAFKNTAKKHGIKFDKRGTVLETDFGKIERFRAALPKSGDGWLKSENARLAAVGEKPLRGCGHFFLGDVRKVTGAQILEAVGLQRGEVDLVTGGPPCQGFSNAGKRDIMDPRNSLVFEFARLVCEILPKTMAFENVPNIVNMVTPEGIPVLDALCRILEDGGMGGYEALKNTMRSTSGVGVATNTRAKISKKAKLEPVAQKPEESQLEMFTEV